MLYLLLKIGRLPLELFLAFLLMIGSIPGPTEGLKCKHCSDEYCSKIISPDCSTLHGVGNRTAMCWKFIFGDIVHPQCASKEVADCARNATSTAGIECISFDDLESNQAFMDEVDKCHAAGVGGAAARKQAKGRQVDASADNSTTTNHTDTNNSTTTNHTDTNNSTTTNHTDTNNTYNWKGGLCFCDNEDYCDSDFGKAVPIKLIRKPMGPGQVSFTAKYTTIITTTVVRSAAQRLHQMEFPTLAVRVLVMMVFAAVPLHYG